MNKEIKMNTIKIKANAKINLFLDITGKRDDGYHELDSVMMSVGIADLLTFEKTETAGFEIICDKEGFPLDESNIIWKAAKALFDKYELNNKAGLRITVEKNIPSQAGMGGGSADGAAALIAVNELFSLGLSENELIELGAKIGADVPFCIKGGCCICQGIGEKLSKIPFYTAMPLLIIKPHTAVSTPAAYKAYDGLVSPEHKDIADIIKAIESSDITGISYELFNAFELVIHDDEIKSAKNALQHNGAIGTLMTGSGSAVFGIFDSTEKAEKAYEILNKENYKVYLCESKSRGIEIINKG